MADISINNTHCKKTLNKRGNFEVTEVALL